MILFRRILLLALIVLINNLSISVKAQLIDNCDELTGWSGGSTLSIDNEDKKEGTGCLKSLGNGTDDFKKNITPLAITTSDILRFWYYVEDVSKLNTGNQVEFGSGGNPDVNEFSWSLNNLMNGWNLIELPISTANITGGNPDLNAMNWFRIYRFKTEPVIIKLDDIQIVKTTGVTTLFEDDFEDGDISNWLTAGTWSVMNGQLRGVANSNIFIGDYDDFEFDTDMILPGNGVRSGLIFRASSPADSDNFSGYFASIRIDKEKALIELQKVNNGRIDLASEMTLDVETGVSQHMKVVCKGPITWIYLNDMETPAITEYDNDYASGYIGLGIFENEAYFDNVRVTTARYASPREPAIKDWSTIRGAGFISSNSVNATQMMEEYDADIVNRELSYAKFYGFNTIRVNLHWLLWDKDKATFLANFEDLLHRANNYDIKVIPVLYDDQGVIDPPHLAPYSDPTPGIHKSQKNTNPGNTIRDSDYEAYRPILKNYVQDVVNAHKDDERILFWIPINEPVNLAPSQTLAADAYAWIKETGTKTLVASTSGGFLGGKYSDFYTYHTKNNLAGADGGSEHLNTGCFNRLNASTTGQEFIDMLDYLDSRQTGFILNDLTIGRDNSRFPLDSTEFVGEPEVPYSGFIYPDGHPWSVAEAKKLNPALDTLPLFNVEYYTGSFNALKKTSIAPSIDFDLGDEEATGSPDASAGLQKDDFSIRWIGNIMSKSAGTYTFYADCDNSVNIWINDTLVLEKITNSRSEVSGSIELAEARTYDIKVEYVHATGNASLHVHWAGPDLAKQVLLGNYYEINEAPVIISGTSAIGTLGAPFSYAIIASNNPTNFSTGILPEGLSLDNSKGVISGLPVEAGTYAVDIYASNQTGYDTLTIRIDIIEDPFLPFIQSVPKVNEIIRTTSSLYESVPITTKEITFSSKNGINTVYAIMAYPQAAGSYPGIMFLHGGGANAETVSAYSRSFAALGYVAIACDMPGICGMDNTPYSTGPWKARPAGETPRFDVGIGAGNSILVDAEIAALEAFNLLKTQPNVDSTKLGVAGISWGGYSTTMMAGLLKDKVKAAYSRFGCGFYEKGSFWKGTIEGLSQDERDTWLTYLDAGRRAPEITAPFFIEAASNDTYFWPEAVMETLDAVPGTKNHMWGPNLNHVAIWYGNAMMKNYFNYYLKDEGHPFGNVKISRANRNADGSGIIHLDVQMPEGITASSVNLYYSTPEDNWQSRKWTPIAADFITDGEYTVSIPSDIVIQNVDYYAYVKDSRNNAISSYMNNAMDLSVNLDQTEIPGFKIHPNPGTGLFHIQGNENRSKEYHIVLFDILGKTVFEMKDRCSGNFSFNCTGLIPGIYTINIISGNDFHSEKLMIY